MDPVSLGEDNVLNRRPFSDPVGHQEGSDGGQGGGKIRPLICLRLRSTNPSPHSDKVCHFCSLQSDPVVTSSYPDTEASGKLPKDYIIYTHGQ